MVAGAVAGQLAARRLPNGAVSWIAAGAGFVVATVALADGAALVAGGRHLPRWLASLTGLGLVGWALADILDTGPPSPTSVLGRLALWPLHVDLWALVPVAVAAALVVLGLRGLRGLSVEALERRSSLVGQIRFAATLQDLRTVLVLRRQLAQELPRSRPWVRVGRGRRLPVWTRGWRGVMRWPAARLVRILVLACVAGFALRGVWDGTTPLLVVAGLAVFLAGLDAVESLAQEIDHPGRRDALPIEAGVIHLRHVPVAAVTCLAVVALAAVAGVLAGPSTTAVSVAAVSLAPAALGAAAGGVASVVMGAPEQTDTAMMLPPELTGMRVVVRTVWPPLLATLGVAPVLGARVAADHGVAPIRGAAIAAAPMAVVFAFVCAWVRFRDQAKAWWRAQLEALSPSKRPDATRG
jgi:hypothetical protein